MESVLMENQKKCCFDRKNISYNYQGQLSPKTLSRSELFRSYKKTYEAKLPARGIRKYDGRS